MYNSHAPISNDNIEFNQVLADSGYLQARFYLDYSAQCDTTINSSLISNKRFLITGIDSGINYKKHVQSDSSGTINMVLLEGAYTIDLAIEGVFVPSYCYSDTFQVVESKTSIYRQAIDGSQVCNPNFNLALKRKKDTIKCFENKYLDIQLINKENLTLDDIVVEATGNREKIKFFSWKIDDKATRYQSFWSRNKVGVRFPTSSLKDTNRILIGYSIDCDDQFSDFSEEFHINARSENQECKDDNRLDTSIYYVVVGSHKCDDVRFNSENVQRLYKCGKRLELTTEIELRKDFLQDDYSLEVIYPDKLSILEIPGFQYNELPNNKLELIGKDFIIGDKLSIPIIGDYNCDPTSLGSYDSIRINFVDQQSDCDSNSIKLYSEIIRFTTLKDNYENSCVEREGNCDSTFDVFVSPNMELPYLNRFDRLDTLTSVYSFEIGNLEENDSLFIIIDTNKLSAVPDKVELFYVEDEDCEYIQVPRRLNRSVASNGSTRYALNQQSKEKNYVYIIAITPPISGTLHCKLSSSLSSKLKIKSAELAWSGTHFSRDFNGYYALYSHSQGSDLYSSLNLTSNIDTVQEIRAGSNRIECKFDDTPTILERKVTVGGPSFNLNCGDSVSDRQILDPICIPRMGYFEGEIKLVDQCQSPTITGTLSNCMVKLFSGTDVYIGITDDNGKIKFHIPTGIYRFSTMDSTTHVGEMPCDNYQIEVHHNTLTKSIITYESNSNCKDISFNLARPIDGSYDCQREHEVAFKIFNRSLRLINNVVCTLSTSSLIRIMDAGPDAVLLNDSTVELSVSQLSPLSLEVINLSLFTKCIGAHNADFKMRIDFNDNNQFCSGNEFEISVPSLRFPLKLAASNRNGITSQIDNADLIYYTYNGQSRSSSFKGVSTTDFHFSCNIHPEQIEFLSRTNPSLQLHFTELCPNRISIIRYDSAWNSPLFTFGIRHQLSNDIDIVVKDENRLSGTVISRLKLELRDSPVDSIEFGRKCYEAPTLCGYKDFSSKRVLIYNEDGTYQSKGKCDFEGNVAWLGFVGNGDEMVLNLKALDNPSGRTAEWGIIEGNCTVDNSIACSRLPFDNKVSTLSINTISGSNYYIWLERNPASGLPQYFEFYGFSDKFKLDAFGTLIRPDIEVNGLLLADETIEFCVNKGTRTISQYNLTTLPSTVIERISDTCFQVIVPGDNKLIFNLISTIGVPNGQCNSVDTFQWMYDVTNIDSVIEISGNIHITPWNDCLGSRVFSIQDSLHLNIYNNKKSRSVKTDAFGNYTFKCERGTLEILIDDIKIIHNYCSPTDEFIVGKDTLVNIIINEENICQKLRTTVLNPRKYQVSRENGDSININIKSFDGKGVKCSIFDVELPKNVILDSVKGASILIRNGKDILEIDNFTGLSSIALTLYLSLSKNIKENITVIDQIHLTPIKNDRCLFMDNQSLNIDVIVSSERYECADAEWICSNSFKHIGKKYVNLNYSSSNLCFGVGVPHNLTWYKFRTRDSLLRLSSKAIRETCKGDQLYQIGVGKSTCDSFEVLYCHAHCEDDSIYLSGLLEPFEEYVLWIDGCNGEICDVLVEMNMNIICDFSQISDLIEIGFIPYCEYDELRLCNFSDLRISKTNYFYKVYVNDVFVGDLSDTCYNLDVIGINEVIVKTVFYFDSLQGSMNLRDSVVQRYNIDSLFGFETGYVEGEVVFVEDVCSGNTISAGGENIRIAIEGRGFIKSVFTDSLGVYKTCLPEGEYEIEVDLPDAIYRDDCVRKKSLTIIPSDTSEINFVSSFTNCDNLILDIEVPRSLRIDCNMSDFYFGVVLRNKTNIYKNRISFEVSLDKHMEFTGSTLSHDLVSPKKIILNFNNIKPNGSVRGFLNLRENCKTARIGDEICFTAINLDSITEICLGDTTVTVCPIVRNSKDPNSLFVWPEGEGKDGLVNNYTSFKGEIVFQNVGNDTAYNVRVRHRFKRRLPKFEMVNFRSESQFTSYIEYINENPVVTHIFNDINLPDSLSDPKGSIESIEFEFYYDSIAYWSEVSSDVDIFFDFNEPITTNAVLHTIMPPTEYIQKRWPLCYNDIYNGIKVYRDTSIFDTIKIVGVDTVIENLIEIAISEDVFIDTLICPSNTIVLFNKRFFTEGKHLGVYENEKGCFTNYTVNVYYKDYIKLERDTTILAGSSIFNTVVYSDTTLTIFSELADSCTEIEYNVYVKTSSLSNSDASNDCIVFPVPFRSGDIVYIRCNGLVNSYNIVDLQGKTVHEDIVDQNGSGFSVRLPQPGIYLLGIYRDDGSKGVYRLIGL